MRVFLALVRCPMPYDKTVRHCLSSWITHLLTAVPPRSRATFVERLCGSLISPEGWVTRAISAITRRQHWTTYYKLLERGRLRTLRLAHALFELVAKTRPMEILNLVIDDTLILRQSETALGRVIRHDHAKKANQTTFVQAQCWVTLGVHVLGRAGRKYVLPIVSRLLPVSGNRNKLTLALSLVRGLAPVLKSQPVRILFDACFMRARRVLPLLSRKMRVMGQSRRDTALFLPGRFSQAGSRTTQKIRGKIDARCDLCLVGNRSQTDVVWQGAVGSPSLSGSHGALSRRCAGARRVERILNSTMWTSRVGQKRAWYWRPKRNGVLKKSCDCMRAAGASNRCFTT